MKIRSHRAAWALVAALAAPALYASPAAARELPSTFDCVMDPPQVVKLGSAVSGLLSDVSVDRGSVVEEGQILARVNDTVERATRDVLALRATNTATIEAQQARLEFIEARAKRTRTLLRRGVASRQDMDALEAEQVAARSLLREAQVQLELAEKELARAEAVIALREIRSPISGIIQERRLSVGEYVHQDTHVMTIVRLDPLYVEAFLPVELFYQVRPGDIAQVTPEAPVQGAFAAEVQVVDQVFDPASATFGVRLSLPNPDRTLPGGHRCQVTFALNDGT